MQIPHSLYWYTCLLQPILLVLSSISFTSLHFTSQASHSSPYNFCLSTDSIDLSLSQLWEVVKDREASCAAVTGVTKSWTWLKDWSITTEPPCSSLLFLVFNLLKIWDAITLWFRSYIILIHFISMVWKFHVFKIRNWLKFSCPLSSQQWPQDWKRSVFIPIPKKGNAKECSNYCTIALISHASKVMLKILQARLQQYVNHELSDVQAGFRKGRGTRHQIANICWIMEKAREFQKNIYFCFMTMPKPLTVWITINCGKFWKRWEYQTTWAASWEICMQVRQQQLELDMEQQTGSK